jgi:hypothetical protein
MVLNITKVNFYTVTVQGQITEASKLLTIIAEAGVDLLAYNAIPINTSQTKLTLFPIDSSKMIIGVKKANVIMEGPYSAIIITGNEKPGELAEIYRKLSKASIPVEESSGIAHINGGYGVVLYLQKEDCDRAEMALRK